MTATPWRAEHWSVSPHNFDPAIQVPPHRVELHDITIRDGEECADVAFTVDDKVKIVEALAAVGMRRTELFLTVPGWLEAVRAILARQLPIDLYVDWHPGRVEKAIDAGVRHIMVWYLIGEHLQTHVLGKSRAELEAQAAAQIEAAVKLGCHVNLFMPECSRASLEHLRSAVELARDAGAKAVTMVDSYGVMRPAAVRYVVEQMTSWSDLDVDVHCHNDFGLSTANVLAAYEGGAVGLNVCVNGLGYRAGNAPMDEAAAALKILYGADTGIDLTRLPWLSRTVADLTGIEPGYFKPIVGDGAFSVERWGSTAKLTPVGERCQMFPFEPEVVGRSPRVVVGKWSDMAALGKCLTDLGLTATPEQMGVILTRCQQTGIAHGRPLHDHEILEIATAGGAVYNGE